MNRIHIFNLIMAFGALSVQGMKPAVDLNQSVGFSDRSRICFSDHPDWDAHSAEMIRQRYDLYRQAGCQMVRIHTLWNAFEQVEGQWNDAACDTLLDEVKRSGFKVKLIAGVIMSPPSWYLEKNPDAQMVDQFGQYSRNCISYWYPGLEEVLESKLRRILQTLEKKDMLQQVEYILVDLGPAGEGIYPANWTMDSTPGHETRDDEAFACYSRLAQQDFRKQMKAKYSSIEKADKAWGTSFADWEAVEIPQPGTITGTFWEDMLYWYRDSKRKVFRMQIRNVSERIKEFNLQAKPLVYLPGSCMLPQDIQAGAEIGGGGHPVRLMIDNEYLMQVANSYGCILQNTGFENLPEVLRMKERMKRDGVDSSKVWGENAGHIRGAGDPIYLAKIVIEENLWGLDYTHTRFVLKDDFITPNQRYIQLKEAVRLIRQYYEEGKVPDFNRYYAEDSEIKSKINGCRDKSAH